MRLKCFRTLFISGCFVAMAACKPVQSTSVTQMPETATVEEKIQKFKADPSKINLVETEKALADLNAEIKKLEVQEATVGGAEKDQITKKLSDLRQKYNAYTAEFTTARVQSSLSKAGESTEEALQKAGDAVKGASESIRDSLKSDKSRD
jgi:hypothetical protein